MSECDHLTESIDNRDARASKTPMEPPSSRKTLYDSSQQQAFCAQHLKPALEPVTRMIATYLYIELRLNRCMCGIDTPEG